MTWEGKEKKAGKNRIRYKGPGPPSLLFSFFSFPISHHPPPAHPHLTLYEMTNPDLTAFLAWALENEIIWDKDAIEIREGKHGLGIFAKKNLEAGYEGMPTEKGLAHRVHACACAPCCCSCSIMSLTRLVSFSRPF